MKKLFLLLSLVLISTPLFAQGSVRDSLLSIPSFQYINSNLSSAGMPDTSQFIWIKKAGFDHVISLNQGDFSFEKDSLSKMDISFTQIEVDSKNPTLENFQTFITDMDLHRGEKILVHCKTNRKASAFVYAYRVRELNADQDKAYKLTQMMWDPHGGFPPIWNSFFDEVLNKQ